MIDYAKYNAERAARDEKLRRKYAAVTAQYAREHLAKSAGK